MWKGQSHQKVGRALGSFHRWVHVEGPESSEGRMGVRVVYGTGT
jgi:hypothetical protein